MVAKSAIFAYAVAVLAAFLAVAQAQAQAQVQAHASHARPYQHGLGALASDGVAGRRPEAVVGPVPTSMPDYDSLSLGQFKRDETYTATNTSSLPQSAITIGGQPSATASNLAHQNLLAIMPAFAFSQPAQTVVAGINIALISVLATHLLFTLHYHLPLSRSNWILQLSSTIILLVNLVVHLHSTLETLEHESHQWPFMFPYLAEGLPPGDGSWTTVQEAFYLLLRAITTVLIHLTHIQFLTLLFPSALEARLILWMLGPMALAAAGMEFTWLSPDDDVKTSDLGDAIRNICNSTLTLLYTSALMIWGGLVNRRRAWRCDGGTAAFGGGAMGLAVMNTAMSFVQIRYDRLWWLPDICWTLTIWQSWLGFWWWVGAGMGIGEVEDRAERDERRRKRRERIKRKLEKEQRQRQKAEQAAARGEDGSEVLNGIKKIKDKITGFEDATISRRIRATLPGIRTPGEDIELREIAMHTEGQDSAQAGEAEDDAPRLTQVSVVTGDDARTTAGSGSSESSPPTTSAQTGPLSWMQRVSTFVGAYQPAFVRRRMRRLRLAHAAAARKAATEQTAVRNQVLNANRFPGLRGMVYDNGVDGAPGLAATDQARRGSRSSNAATARRRSPAVSPSVDEHSTSNGGSRHRLATDSTTLVTDPSSSSSSREGVVSNRRPTSSVPPLDTPSVDEEEEPEDQDALSAGRQQQRRRRQRQQNTRSNARGHVGGDVAANTNDDDDDADVWLEEPGDTPAPGSQQQRKDSSGSDGADEGATSTASGTARPGRPEQELPTPGADDSQGRSWTWRGGLDRVRLRDRQRYD